jgi:hypothetical protein
MKLDEDFIYPSFFRTVIGVYGFSFVMLSLAVLPGLNFAYSGHRGLAWFFIPLCGPWVVLRALYKIWHATSQLGSGICGFLRSHSLRTQSTYGSTFPVRRRPDRQV